MMILDGEERGNLSYQLKMDRGKYPVEFMVNRQIHHRETYLNIDEAKDAAKYFFKTQRVRKAL